MQNNQTDKFTDNYDHLIIFVVLFYAFLFLLFAAFNIAYLLCKNTKKCMKKHSIIIQLLMAFIFMVTVIIWIVFGRYLNYVPYGQRNIKLTFIIGIQSNFFILVPLLAATFLKINKDTAMFNTVYSVLLALILFIFLFLK